MRAPWRGLALLLLIALGVQGCDDDTATPDPRPADGSTPLENDAGTIDATPPPADSEPAMEVCNDGVNQLYAPFESPELQTFPDVLLTEDDPSTPTGLRLIGDTTQFPWLANLPGLLQPVANQLSGLSGFATNGALMFRFDASIAPPTESVSTSLTTSDLQLYDLGTTPPTRVGYRGRLADGERTLFVQPVRPLRPGQPHLLVMTDDYLAAEASCIKPSPFMSSVLAGGELPPKQARLATLLGDALSAVEVRASQVVAASTFTTQADLDVMYAVARDIKTRQFSWRGMPECEDRGPMRYCVGAFKVWDYRAEKQIEGPTPSGQQFVPVQTWIPKNADGPVPIIVYAHGLNSEAATARYLAADAARLGFGIVATDAVYHGQHPSRDDDAGIPALQFLGLDLTLLQLDPMVLRGSFNQTTAERLQLLQLLRTQPDVDGDGSDDIDSTQIAYYGLSLGGMLGPSLTALDDGIGAAVFAVAGGRLLDFATQTGQVDAFRPVIDDLAGGPDRLERLLPVAQTLVDAADPATYGAHVLRDRRDGSDQHPEVLMPVAVFDDTVPPSTGKALARAMGLTHVKPIYEEVATLEVVDAPFRGPDEEVADTAAFFQYDRVTLNGNVVRVDHNNLHSSDEGRLQIMGFLGRWQETGNAEVIDPYGEIGTPPL